MTNFKTFDILKRKILPAIFLLIAASANSQILFIENFNYPPMDSVLDINSWDNVGSTGNRVKISSPGLNYTGYKSSAIGNTATLSNISYSQGILNMFDPQTSGTVYFAFLIRTGNLSATMTEGFVACLDEWGGPTNFNTKVYLKKTGASTFNFGIRKTSGIINYSPTNFNANTTYLAVCSYTIIAGDNNDVSKVHIFSSGIPASEPSLPLVSASDDYDITDIGEVALTNSFNQDGLKGTEVKIDGIRIGKTWTSTFNDNLNCTMTMNGNIQGFYNPVSNKMVKDTMKVYLRYPIAPYHIADSSKAVVDSTGKGIFTFANVTRNAEFYITVKHRNTIETWSNIPKYFNNSFLMTQTFNSSISNAYGNNLIGMGSRFCFYNGDANGDNAVNLADLSAIYNNATTFSTGYLKTDMDGNNVTNLTDLTLTYNNATNFVTTVKP